jgi:long-chain acyl-CoA synthetase
MHPYQHAQAAPDRPAYVSPESGFVLTYGALEAESNRAAQLFRFLGLTPGDVVAVLLKNGPDYPIVYWGAQRSGLMMTPISTHLKTEEIAYILRDCGAKVLITSLDADDSVAPLIARRGELAPALVEIYTVGAEAAGALNWRLALDSMPATRIADEISGYYLVYSGGSTGRPKGVLLPFTPGPIEEPSTETERPRRSIIPPRSSRSSRPKGRATPWWSSTASTRYRPCAPSRPGR